MRGSGTERKGTVRHKPATPPRSTCPWPGLPRASRPLWTRTLSLSPNRRYATTCSGRRRSSSRASCLSKPTLTSVVHADVGRAQKNSPVGHYHFLVVSLEVPPSRDVPGLVHPVEPVVYSPVCHQFAGQALLQLGSQNIVHHTHVHPCVTQTLPRFAACDSFSSVISPIRVSSKWYISTQT